jgi:hypothetical protein
MLKRVLTSAALLTFTLSLGVQTADAAILFNNDLILQNTAPNKWVIDAQDGIATGGNVGLQFGSNATPSNNGLLNWNMTAKNFEVDHPVSLQQNQIKDVGLDMEATDPASPQPGQFYYNTVNGHPWIYNGLTSTWENISAVSAYADKVVSVGPGLDFTSIESAAGYLNARSGGIMLLSAGTHTLTNPVDLTNITMIGKDAVKTTLSITGNGHIDSFDTSFANMTISVGTINNTMALDMQSGSSSLYMEWVDFSVQDSGTVLVDSEASTPPTVVIKVVNSSETGGNGTLLKTKATANLNAASNLYISSASGNGLIQVQDWNVTIAGYGNVYTTGTISTIPSNTIYVYPGMNLQGAINSLSSGGSLTLLPGTNSITAPLLISTSNIQVSGYGDDSVIAASGFAGATNTTAAIQVGAANGTASVNQVTLKNFKLTVSGDTTAGTDIHGIRFTGGSDHTVDNVTVQKIAGQSGTGTTARMGIQMLDGTATQLIRPKVINNRIFGNGGSNYFTDGIHVTSDPSIAGVFGYNSGITDAYVEGNSVDYVRETAYVFVGVTNSSLSNNRASRMGAIGGGAYGIYLGNTSNSKMDGNVFSGTLGTSTVAIGIESFAPGSLKETKDSVFSNNIIDGAGNGGVGFGTGFQIGNASNTGVHRNTFQNNTIKGASSAGGTEAFVVRGNADDNLFADNDIDGVANPWATGIDLQSALQERNIISGNRYNNVTTRITDVGTDTRIGVMHREDSNPTVNDDRTLSYYTDTIWVNTATQRSYISVNDAVGAAVWNALDNDAIAEKYKWLNIGGGVEVSVTEGSIAGGNSAVLLFDGTNSSSDSWSFPVPEDWQPGTNINMDVLWSPSDATAGNVVLDCNYASWSVGQVVGSSNALSSTVAVPGVADQLVTTTFALASANLAAGRMVNFKITRDPTKAADTYAGNMNIQKIRIRYTGKKLQ